MNLQKFGSANKVATIKIMDNFHYKWKPSCAYHKIKQKTPLEAEATSKNKNTLTIVKVHWFEESVRQTVNQFKKPLTIFLDEDGTVLVL